VVGDRLDQRRRLAEHTGHGGVESTGLQIEIEHVRGHEPLGLGQERELLDPRREQRGPVGRVDRDGASLKAGALLDAEQLGQRPHRLLEHLTLAGGLDLELDLGRVIHPAIHDR
jgi:hypothetical protein